MTSDSGTLLYMAPVKKKDCFFFFFFYIFFSKEIILSSRYNEFADIYSLGLLFIEIYIEKNPFHNINFHFIAEIIDKHKEKLMVFTLFFYIIFFTLFFYFHFFFFFTPFFFSLLDTRLPYPRRTQMPTNFSFSSQINGFL